VTKIAQRLILPAVLGGFILTAMMGCTPGQNDVADKPVVLRFMTFPTPDLVILQEKMCRAFERLHPDIKIDYTYIRGFDYYDRMLTSFVGGTAPDVFWTDVGYGRAWMKRGVMLDITDYVERDLNPDDYLPESFELLRADERIYGICDAVGPIIVCYNKDVFDKAGVAYPNGDWDWEEFREVAKRLTLRDDRDRAIQYGYCGFQWDTLGWRHFMWTYGGDVFSRDGSRCILDDPITVDAMEFLHRLYEEDRVMPAPNQSEGSASMLLFIANRAGMVFSGPWFRRDMRRVKNLRWGIAHVPYGSDGKRHASLAQRHLAISADTNHPEEAWEFVRFQMGYDCMKVYLEGGDAIPTLKSIALGPFIEFDPRYPQEDMNHLYIEALSYSHGVNTSPYMEESEIKSLVRPEIERYLILGEVSAEEAVRRAANRIRAHMEANRKRELRRESRNMK
jgi:multiple sugar transport system substrate-binding protein